MGKSKTPSGEYELATTEIDFEEVKPGRNMTAPPPLPPAARNASTPSNPPPASTPKAPEKGSSKSPVTVSNLSSSGSQTRTLIPQPPKPPQPSKPLKPTTKQLPVAANLLSKPPDANALPQISPPEAPPQVIRTPEEQKLSDSPHVIDAHKMIDFCKQELAGRVDNHRAARLYYEIGNYYETILNDIQSAFEHYQTAYKFQKDHRPSIQGARRTLIDAHRFQDAIPFFDGELPLISDPNKRAQLMLAKGLLLEHDLHQRDQALNVYMEAISLDSTNLDLLRAIGRCQFLGQGWGVLDLTYHRISGIVEGEPTYRAAIIAERAKLSDIHKQDAASAAQLYEAAIAIDPDTPGALEALKRLSHTQCKWLQLMSSLEHESTRSVDPEVRAAAQLNIAHLQLEKFGNTDGGIAALENAFRETPTDRTLLNKLCAVYQENNRPRDLIDCLERLYRLTEDKYEQVVIAQRMGGISEAELHEDARAEFWNIEALKIDGGFLPAFQALEKLYEKTARWTELLTLYENELQNTRDPSRCAAVHCRIGDLFETRLADPVRAAEHHVQALEIEPGYEASFNALSRLYTQAHRWSELVAAYERMIDRSRHQEVAIAYLFRIGALYEDRLNDPAGAVHAYQRILKRESDHLGAIEALQRAASHAEKYDVLVGALEKEASLSEKDQRWAALMYRVADLFDKHMNDPLAAIDRLRRVLEIDSKHRLALDAIGRIYYRVGRWDDLLAIYETELKQTKHGPQWVALSHKIAELTESQLGRPAEAISRHKRTLAAEPSHAPSFFALARLLTASQAWSDLAQLLEARIEKEPDARSKAYRALELGQLFEEKLNVEKKALSFYDKAIQLCPGFRPAIDARARLLTKIKDFKRLSEELILDAESLTDTALKIDKLLRAGTIQAEFLNDAQAAIATFESVLQIGPSNLGALLALEGLYLKVQDRVALERVYLQEVQILKKPATKVATLHDLANLYRAANQPERQNLQNIYRAIVELAPEDPVALEALAAIARGQNDPKAVFIYESKLASVATDPAVSALHCARVAQILENSNDPQAIAAYRAALALDPNSFSAVRGLTRTAWSLGTPDALAEAAYHESVVIHDTEIAVQLLLRAAKQRHAQGDFEQSVDDLEKALELNPDHPLVTALLSATLLQIGDVPKLVELLSRAADRARVPDRSAELYIEISDLKEKQLGSLPGAISALERALVAMPGYLPALQRLAIYLELTKQWERAIDAYDQIVKQAQDDTVKIDAHLRLATLAEECFDNRQRAYISLKAVLALDPSHKPTLVRLENLYTRDGDFAQALSIARRLVDTTDNLADKAAALTSIARIYVMSGQPKEVEAALSAAIEIEGAEGTAAKAYREMIGRYATWASYVDALCKYLARAREQRLPGGSSAREIALVEVDQLRQPQQALKTLEAGIRDWPTESGLWIEYARQLNRVGQHEQALDVSRARIQADIFSPDIWRELSKAHRAMARVEESLHSAQPLLLLEAATNEELVVLRSRQSKYSRIVPGVLNDSLIREIQVEEAFSNMAVPLVESVSVAIAKLFPPDLKKYGVSRRDRIGSQSGNVFRATADKIAAIVGAPEFDLYFHQNPSNDITIELTEPLTLMVPTWTTELSPSERVFLLARKLTFLGRQLQVVDQLVAPELATIITAAIRTAVPGYISSNTSSNKVDEMVRKLKGALSRKDRRIVEQKAEGFSTATSPDFERWIKGVQMTVSRVALLVSDDLVASVKMIERTSGETLKHNASAADLVRFWVSDPAIRFRERL